MWFVVINSLKTASVKTQNIAVRILPVSDEEILVLDVLQKSCCLFSTKKDPFG